MRFPELLIDTSPPKRFDSPRYTLSMKEFFFLLEETGFRISKMLTTTIEGKQPLFFFQ